VGVAAQGRVGGWQGVEQQRWVTVQNLRRNAGTSEQCDTDYMPRHPPENGTYAYASALCAAT
jgi:hypothetical protein